MMKCRSDCTWNVLTEMLTRSSRCGEDSVELWIQVGGRDANRHRSLLVALTIEPRNWDMTTRLCDKAGMVNRNDAEALGGTRLCTHY